MQSAVNGLHWNYQAYLLWIATYAEVPVGCLLEPDFEMLFNLVTPNWTSIELGDVLDFMHRSNSIEYISGITVVNLSRTMLTEHLFATNFKTRRNSLRYRITPSGAFHWERLFNPLWEKAVIFSARPNTNPYRMNVELYSKCEKNLRDLFLRDIPHSGEALAVDSIKEISPWNPVYWKAFPKGFKLIGRCDERFLDSIIEIIPNWHLSFEQVVAER